MANGETAFGSRSSGYLIDMFGAARVEVTDPIDREQSPFGTIAIEPSPLLSGFSGRSAKLDGSV